MELVAYSTAALTLGLVVTRPRLTATFRVNPAMAAFAGVAMMLALGIVDLGHFERAARDLWTPFVAIAAIMVMTDVAFRVGLLELWANWVDSVARSASRLFALVFLLGVLTSTTLNNDAAILLLTPLVVSLVRRRFPDRPELMVPFAFAVFISAGVAPFPISNPMNMVVADFSGIRFNSYAVRMLPIAMVCWGARVRPVAPGVSQGARAQARSGAAARATLADPGPPARDGLAARRPRRVPDHRILRAARRGRSRQGGRRSR